MGTRPPRRPTAASPERPRYEIEGTTPRWLDLEGYYTRFGDVRELLLGVDDRYVIMNAGDELRLRFPEAPAAPPGIVRDFVVVTDGWEKDGDFNTTFSRTVLPLPTHRSGRYDHAPGRLEDDPVYLQHPKDFAEYHTRYVTPDRGPPRAAHAARTQPRDHDETLRTPILALIFVALLATPSAHAALRSPAAAAARARTCDPRAQYGFRLDESAKAAGLDFVHEAPTLDPKLAHIMPQVASMGAAVSVVDVDADGHPDLYVTNSREG